jgi:hypothetical protein
MRIITNTIIYQQKLNLISLVHACGNGIKMAAFQKYWISITLYSSNNIFVKFVFHPLLTNSQYAPIFLKFQEERSIFISVLEKIIILLNLSPYSIKQQCSTLCNTNGKLF